MRKFLISLVLLTMLGAAGSYAFWAQQRPVSHYLSDLRIQVDPDQGSPGDRGNVLGVQTELSAGDYQSLERLHLKLAAYLQEARKHGLINAKTVVVLPEQVGTWLWAVGEKPQLYQAEDRKEAQHWLALSNPLRFAWAYLTASGQDRLADARLRMKADDMARDYQQLFGGLAQEFAVTLIAGTVVLPAPYIDKGVLHAGSGALYNASVVFSPAGQALGQPQRQLRPAANEQGYLTDAADEPLQVFETPAGPLGLLIGQDSRDPANHQRLTALSAQLIVVPAAQAGIQSWASQGRKPRLRNQWR